MLEEKGGRGFPFLVFLDSEGNVILEHTGDRSPEGFEKSGARVLEYVDLKKKADGGDKAAREKLVWVELDLGRLKAAEAEKRLKELKAKITPEQRGRLELQAAYDELTRDVRLEAGKKFYDLWKRKVVPRSDDRMHDEFWNALMHYCRVNKIPDGFEEGIRRFKEKYGSRADEWAAEQEKTLERIKQKK